MGMVTLEEVPVLDERHEVNTFINAFESWNLWPLENGVNRIGFCK
jgi:hypothetical protein